MIAKHVSNDENEERDVEVDKRMPVEVLICFYYIKECVKYILEAADRRARKVFLYLIFRYSSL